ncbi:Protein phosphatase 1 regulatory subunit 3C-B [Collichthys lucidus]|uniref:Protein phosphatase 1 regulatory subunit 3C-B n=1 Tax=Collichthys lucidus TaxID=240159 RepID=A0A4U5V8T5_COLLU|nr:Protein phosphatase 1 regulatory subunit 3C-B [Collichthys lucidus]
MLVDRQARLRKTDKVTAVKGMCEALVIAWWCDLTSTVKVCMEGMKSCQNADTHIVYKITLNLRQPSGKDRYLVCHIYSFAMNCTRVLHAIGSHPQTAVMPVDLAMCLSLSRRQPLYQLLTMSPLKLKQHHCQPTDCPSRTSPRSLHQSSSPYPPSSLLPSSSVPSEPRSCFRRDSGGLNKKRVVFADAKGLALTAVRLFIPEASSPTSTLLMKPIPTKLQGQQSTSIKRYKLRPGFAQPTVDFKAFIARLRETHVQLESCNISEHSLSGKVCVSHVSAEKSVHVRVTFDSWRNHHDIPCTFLQQQQRYGGSDIDVFAFDLSLPKNIDPKERVEFCVYFRPGPGATAHWDDNRGHNYRVCVEKDGSNANQNIANHYHPTLSQHRPPSCPSHVSTSMPNSAELWYLQRGLSNRVKAECKALCLTK